MKAIFKTLLFVLCLFKSYSTFATILPQTNGTIRTISGSPVVKNTATATITPQIAPTSTNTSFTDISKKGVVTFGVDHHYPAFLSAYTVQIKAVVQRYPTLTGGAIADTTIILNITYQPNNPDSLSFMDKHTITFGSAVKYKLVITDITVNGSAQTTLPANLYVQGDVFVDRIYNFATQTTTVTSTDLGLVVSQDLIDINCDHTAETIRASWNPIMDAEEYQLEWVYVNDYGFTSGSPTIDFKNNATRISTTQTSYDLSMIFDKGYICFRVRAVGRSSTSPYLFLFTPWSTADGSILATAAPNFHNTTAFDGLKNWQYSSTFAEEGKKKEVLTFFDGSLRNRQMVTKITSDKNAIVGETIYDHLGRPAIQVLPAPVLGTVCLFRKTPASLRFYGNFNRNMSNHPYNADDVEQLNPSNVCTPVSTPAMNTTDGASRYYSPQNPNLVGNAGYVPNGGGYPFSQVEYTPDNTGRISRQGGVGSNFQLGLGHETKYFYAHPFQEQLDRLFGSEVGNAAHYQKNMVVDPNGQVSISYLDQEGRVIATSLAGKVPDSLLPLPSAANTAPLTVDLFAKDASTNSSSNILSQDGKSKVFNQTIALSSKSDVTIHYDMNVAAYHNSCLPQNICFSCVYDLRIEVRDICGSLKSPTYVSNKMIGNFTELPGGEIVFNTTCAATTETNTFTIPNMEVGTYQISKVLSINEDALNSYLDKYVTDSLNLNTCFTNYDEYLEQETESSDIDNCNEDFSCQECVTNLGTLLAFIQAGGTEAEYQQALDECNAPCKPISYYETMRLVLMADVMPGGQYAEYLNSQGNLNETAFPLSVLNASNSLPKASTAYWKYPQYDLEATIQNSYFEPDGVTLSRIPLTNVVLNVGGTQVSSSSPQVTLNAPVNVTNSQVFLDPATNEYYTYPQYLRNVSDFIQYYLVNTHWSNSLVYYHPEYPILSIFRSFTEKNAVTDQYTSESFDQEMTSINTFQGAIDNGFITGNLVNNFNAISSTLPWDPYSVYNSTALQNKINNYLQINSVWFSMMEVAAMITRCPNELIGYMPSASCTQFGTNFGSDPVQNTQIKDAEWMAFRGLYVSAKQALQLEYAKTQSLTNPSYYGYNACIGNDNFSPIENGFITISSGLPFTVGGEYWNPQQPCNINNHLKYINKQKRFGNPTDYVDPDPVQAAYQVYLQTGQCPIASSFQLLLNQTAQQHVLENSPINMNTLTATSAVLMAIQDFEVSGPLPALTWTQTVNTSSDLEVKWEEGSLLFAKFHLVKNPVTTPTFDWSEIVSFTNLQYTLISGGLYEFTVTAKVNQGGTIFTRELTGNTTLQIGNCSFPDQCVLNDQGKAMEKMMKLLAAGSQLTNTSYVTVSSAPFDAFCTPQFQYAVNPSPTGVVNFRYIPSLPGFEFVDAGSVLTLGINSVEPTTFNLASLSLVASISEMIPGPNNTFKLVCKDLSGNALVTLNCDAIQSASSTIGLQMGTCGLADPILCQGAEYQTFDDLYTLFQNVLVNQNEPFNLVSSPQWSTNLIGLLPTNPTTLPSTTTISGGRKKLIFTLPGSCALVLSSKITTVNFNNITAVSAMHVVEPADANGAYYDFYLLVTYTNGGTTLNDTLFGTSCLKLNECNNCNQQQQSIGYTAEQLETITSNLKIAGILEEDNSIISYVDYKNAVAATNNRLSWTPANAEFIQTIGYNEYFDKGFANSIVGYIHFATNFVDGLDDHYYLENPSNYIDKYGSGDNLLASYDRYVKAVQSYNQDRVTANKTTIPIINLNLFAQTVYSEDCSDYVRYLDQQIDNIPSALAVNNYPNTQAAMIDEGQCMDLYINYYNAYQTFITDQQTTETCMDYEITMPLVPYQTFIDNNLCCSTYGVQVLTDYIASFAIKNTCPGPLPMMQDCTSPTVIDMDLCRDNWSLYVSNIDSYNNSDWAINHESTLLLLYPTFKTFSQMGFCECIVDYNNYLQTYINARSTDELPLPLTIDQFCDQLELDYGTTPCQDQYEAYLHCVAAYNEKAVTKGNEYVVSLVTMEAFYESDLCYCVDAYCSQLNMVLDGLQGFDRMPDLYTFCNDVKEEPCVHAGANVYETFEMEFDDPCTEFYESNISVNALINYNEQVQNLQTTLAQEYIKHCMSAFENMTLQYNEIEHHFTLYYYDQAGNLIRTVPPEGVELLDISNVSIKTKISQDRQNNTHQVMTNHRMATTYLYNSLNQLVSQNMPDQDAMTIFETVAPNGLPIGLNTNAIQMVDANIGYLTGYISNTSVPLQNRGYLFKTTNGGSNWTRVANLLNANLKEVVMTTSTKGYAVGNDGILLITNDAGFNWDLMNTYAISITEDFVALDKDPTNAYALTKSGKIWELTGATITPTSFNLSAISNVTVNEVKDFTLQGVSPSTGTTLYLANITSNGSTYDAVLMRVGATTTTTVESAQVADLKTIGFYSSDDGLAAGIDGNLSAITGTGTSSFMQKLGKSGTTGIIDQLYLINNLVGVARIEENGTKVIRKTTDGGLTWENLQGDYTNASLTFIKQTATSKDILIQGYNTSTLKSYTRTVVLLTNGVVELNQTPNIPQGTEMKCVASFIDGSNIYYFGIGADNKLYRSNAFTSTDVNVNYTPVSGLAALPSTAKKVVAIRNGSNGISIEILLASGSLYRTFCASLTGAYDPLTPVSGASSLVAIDKMTLPSGDYLVAYSGNTLYGKGAAGTSLSAFTTTITLGTSVIENLVVHGQKVSLVGTNGGLFTTNAIIATIPSAVTFTDRKNHGYTDLTSIRTNGNYVLITGKNGLAASRTKSTATQTSFVRPLNTLSDIYESAYRLNGSDEYLSLVGSNGYFSEQKVVSGAWTQQPTAYTTFGNTLATYATGKTLRSIAVNGQAVYLAGDQGAVFYTANINTAFFIPATPVTANTLNSVVFIPGQTSKVVMVGNQTEVSKYNASAGTHITAIHPAKLKDVHFENGQTGTVVGDYYFIRTTTTGSASWQTVPVASVIAASVTTTGIQKVITKIATNGTHHYLLGTSDAVKLMNGNTLISSTAMASAVSDIQFNKSLPLKGYVSAGTALWSVDLTSDLSGTTYTVALASLTTAPNAINALHIFENHSVAMAGANGMIYYRKSSGAVSTLATVAGATFNDIYFQNNISGVVVGNAGKFYYLSSNGNDATTHELTSTVAYTAEAALDPELGNNTGYNIRAIAYSTLNKAVYGGEYINSTDVTGKKAFVRSLKQERSLYTSRFFYDRLGRIVVSQNSRQLIDNKFSYTLYDNLGRVYEAGEKAENTSATTKFSTIFGTYVSGSFVPSVVDDTNLGTWLTTEATTTRKEVTRSYYDVTNTAILSELPITLDATTQRKRIVHVTYEAVYDGVDNIYDHATHYDYDIHGNVKTILQDNRLIKNISNISQHRFKRMDYIYDLISGNVHRVDYETGKADQWHHAYSYDEDNRIMSVYTSTETPITTTASSMASLENEPVINPLWDKEAVYSYYAHGPLARTVLGDEEVQGLDYVYTLQGWIKSVNSNTLDVNRDPGEDGKGLAVNRNVARDVYGYSLHYFEGDYAGAINGNNTFLAAQPMNSGMKQQSFDLFNGNIATMVTTITNPNTRAVIPLGNAYKYDQLNRLKEARSYNNINLAGNTWNSGGTQMYYNAFDYDANGNIIHQVRKDDANVTIDDMSYYYENQNGTPDSKYVNPAMKVKRNRLRYVNETVNYDGNDIDPGMAATNYGYDAEGRLTSDTQERIDRITWRVDGKVRKIEHTPGGAQKNLIFDYDALGHRIAKHVYSSNNVWEKSTYYVLDAQGNTMAVYQHANDDVNHVITFAQTEKHIYGSSRLGINNKSVSMFGSQNATYSMRNIRHYMGKRTYELNNHLGNVLSIISDKVIPHNNGGTPDYWLADIRQATDYSPFGVILKSRDIPLTAGTGGVPYRYGFNGYEGDNEVKGTGNSYTTEFRQYDPRLGRWLTTDPLAIKYPNISPYVGYINNPISIVDNNGDSVARFGYFTGNFLGFFDDGKTTWSFQRGYYNDENKGEWKTVGSGLFNDPEIDTRAIKNGAITRMEVLTDQKVEKQIDRSGVKEPEAQDSPIFYAKKEGANKMDYGVKGIEAGDFRTNTFYVREGIAYNVADIGNYLFGRGAAELNLDLSTATLGAHYNNAVSGKSQKTPYYDFGPGTYGSPGFFDAKSDQNAIHRGYKNAPIEKERVKNKNENNQRISDALYGGM